MKNTLKILGFAAIIAVIGLSFFACDPDRGNDISEFKFVSLASGYEVSEYTGADTVVVIPATHNGKPVVSVGERAFWGMDKITSITIPASVISIGSEAFNQCSGLISVIFATGSQLATIGHSAFVNCPSLTNITIPTGVTYIGAGAFGGTNITSVTIPAGVTSINGYVFSGCTGLTSIAIHAGITSIGEGAFAGTGIASVTFAAGNQLTSPEGVTSIGPGAFINSTSLTSITIPASVISLGERDYNLLGPGWFVFEGWLSPQTINIPFETLNEADDVWSGYWRVAGISGDLVPSVIRNNVGVQIWPVE